MQHSQRIKSGLGHPPNAKFRRGKARRGNCRDTGPHMQQVYCSFPPPPLLPLPQLSFATAAFRAIVRLWAQVTHVHTPPHSPFLPRPCLNSEQAFIPFANHAICRRRAGLRTHWGGESRDPPRLSAKRRIRISRNRRNRDSCPMKIHNVSNLQLTSRTCMSLF